jgi:tRNA(Ile2) C34 agmatinyltransferase TiaS
MQKSPTYYEATAGARRRLAKPLIRIKKKKKKVISV